MPVHRLCGAGSGRGASDDQLPRQPDRQSSLHRWARRLWVYDGAKWVAYGVAQGIYLPLTGGKLTGALNPAGGVIGVVDGSDAAPGMVGEYIVNNGSAVALTTNVSVNAVSIPLTAGDWDVSGNTSFLPSAVVASQVQCGVTSTSGVMPGIAAKALVSSGAGNMSVSNLHISPQRFSLTALTTTIYMVVNATFASGTCTGTGCIRARRMR